VAGAFTIDGLGGAFIDRIEGDSHTVVGLSLKVLRELAAGFGVYYPSFWR
jgi:septum formation protein